MRRDDYTDRVTPPVSGRTKRSTFTWNVSDALALHRRDMPRATLRFYAELNDFLPPKDRHQPLERPVHGRPSIKDLIEAAGVPHTEIDLLLVHGGGVGGLRLPCCGCCVANRWRRCPVRWAWRSTGSKRGGRGVFIVAGWLNRHQEDLIDYLREENRVPSDWLSTGFHTI